MAERIFCGFWGGGARRSFFRGFCRRIFSPHSLWEKVPRKILQENPRQNPPKLTQQKSLTHFCRGAGPRKAILVAISLPLCDFESLRYEALRFRSAIWASEYRTWLLTSKESGRNHFQKLPFELLGLHLTFFWELISVIITPPITPNIFWGFK